MRIAIPIHSFAPGGVERVALRLAERWQAAGHEVPIVLGRDRGHCRAQAPALDYRTIAEPVSTARWETLWMIWCMWRFLRRERVDLLFCPGNTYTVICVAMRLLPGVVCPPVLVKISNDLHRSDLSAAALPFYRLWLRVQGLLLARFVALGEPMLPEIIEQLGIDDERALVISDPALSADDLARLDPGKDRVPSRNHCRFLAIGRLSRQKNHLLMVEAFARHAWPGDTLVIAGEGAWRRAIERAVARHGLERRISLVGHVADVAPLLAQADVFVLSSEYEGVPAVMIEALAAGLPIASTRCCASIDWLLGEGAFGVAATPGDADALGIAMNLARHIDPPVGQMRDFAAQFTLERAAGRYLAEMKDLVAASLQEHDRPTIRRVRNWTDRGV